MRVPVQHRGVLRNTGLVILRGTVSLGLHVLGGPSTNPLGLIGPGGSARPDTSLQLGVGGRLPRRPPPAGLGTIARSEVRGSPPAGYYPLAAGRRSALDCCSPPPSPGGVALPTPEGGVGVDGCGVTPHPRGG